MVLPLPPADGPGGMLYMEYAEVTAGERHSLRLHVAQFDQTPVGGDNDYSYTGSGPVSPSEGGVLATFAAVGALWAEYYPPDWTLTLVDVWFNAGGRLTRLDVVPTAAPITGVCAEAEPGGVVQKRIFRVVSPQKSARKIYFSQVPGTQTWQNTSVTPTAGGVDARDRAVMAYLAGSAGGVVSGEGRRFLPEARLRVQWARRLAPLTGLTGPSGTPGPPGPAGTPGTVLPTGQVGDILYWDGTAWVTRRIGAYKQVLTVLPGSPVLLPVWAPPCCDDTTGLPTTVIDPAGGGAGTGAGSVTSACGAALAMASGLEKAYDGLATYLNMGLTQGLAIAGTGFTTVLFDVLTAGFGLPLDGLVATAVFGLAQLVIRSLHLVEWGPLDTSQKNTILQTAFCALPRAATDFQITSAILQAWQQNLATASAVFSTAQVNLLKSLIRIPTLASWDYLAAAGAQEGSTLCAEFVCAAGKSMQGGAFIGTVGGESMSGGAVFGPIGTSMQGGATFSNLTRTSMTGGAHT